MKTAVLAAAAFLAGAGLEAQEVPAMPEAGVEQDAKEADLHADQMKNRRRACDNYPSDDDRKACHRQVDEWDAQWRRGPEKLLQDGLGRSVLEGAAEDLRDSVRNRRRQASQGGRRMDPRRDVSRSLGQRKARAAAGSSRSRQGLAQRRR